MKTEDIWETLVLKGRCLKGDNKDSEVTSPIISKKCIQSCISMHIADAVRKNHKDFPWAEKRV